MEQTVQTLISADNHWALLAVLFAATAIAIWLEQKYKWASKISGAIITLVIALVLVNTHVIPDSAPVFDDIVWGYAVPLAIPLVAGPAALSMVMITAAQQDKMLTLGAVVVASIINSVILMCSFPLSKLLGKRGLAAIERLTGMILILMSVDMVMGGISTFVKL